MLPLDLNLICMRLETIRKAEGGCGTDLMGAANGEDPNGFVMRENRR